MRRLVLWALAALLSLGAAAGEPRIALFDAGASSAAPLSEEALSGRDGWTRIAEGKRRHPFKDIYAFVWTYDCVGTLQGAAAGKHRQSAKERLLHGIKQVV